MLYAISEKEAIGFATYFFGHSGYCGRVLYLDDIYIKPAYRSKGYGTALFKYMAKVGLDKLFSFMNCENIYIVVTVANTCTKDKNVEILRNEIDNWFSFWIIFEMISFFRFFLLAQLVTYLNDIYI